MNGFGKMRKAAGYTQRAVSDLSGIPLSTLRRWEQGINEPDVDSMILLADLYGCTTDDLLGSRFSGAAAARIDDTDPRLTEIIDLYESMTNTGREALLATARGLADSYSKSEDTDCVERSA